MNIQVTECICNLVYRSISTNHDYFSYTFCMNLCFKKPIFASRIGGNKFEGNIFSI